MTAISFQTAFMAIFQIFLMGAVGYFIAHRRFLDEKGLKMLSWLSINVCFPFFIFYQIVMYFKPQEQTGWWAYPLINIMLCLGGFLMAGLFRMLVSKKGSDDVWQATAAFQNAGYIPLLLVTMLPVAHHTQELYAYVILTIIGFDLCLWTLGVSVIAQRKAARIRWSAMFNPPLISMSLAFLAVLLGVGACLPDLVMKPVKLIGDSALAIAMLVIGGNLALTSFRQIQWKQIGSAVAFKLVLLPLCVLVFLKVFNIDGPWGLILMIQACMPTAVSLSIFARQYDHPSQDLINQTIFVTHLLCALTIPLFLGLYARGL